MAYDSYPEPVELRWVAASAGQGSILEAAIPELLHIFSNTEFPKHEIGSLETKEK
ncbi:MAG: hypothetical protein ACRDCT_18175 [Shewanella sp.]|uniref:hypothetical protein n=1 Tax=Aeromonas allosaccharophila TaxID=656 RepID=UPI0036D97E70